MIARLVLCSVSALFFISQVASAAPALPEWTFLIFLNGHNNLDYFGEHNMNQMEEVGSTKNVQVVVQWASIRGGTTKRIFVEKDEDFHKVTSPIVQDMGKRVDMGSPDSLEDFVQWGMKKYPAKHTFVAVWNHGSGWHQNKLSESTPDPLQSREISSDDYTGHQITTEEMGRVLQNVSKKVGRRVDIVGADACLMAMAEVVGEFATAADYFVGSQELEPGYGWPYSDFLTAWNQLARPTPALVAQALVDTYAASYQGGSNGYQNVTLSALDLKHWGTFERAAKDFAMSTLEWTQEQKLFALQAAKDAQKFMFSDYVDLGDWLRTLPFARTAPLQRAMKKLIIANQVTPSHARAQGLTVWIPQVDPVLRKYLTRYEHLVWDQRTLWSVVGQSINWKDSPQ